MIDCYLEHLDSVSFLSPVDLVYDSVCHEADDDTIRGSEADYYMDLQRFAEWSQGDGAFSVSLLTESMCSPGMSEPLPPRKSCSPHDIYGRDRDPQSGVAGLWLAELGGGAAWRARVFYESDHGIKRRRLSL